MSNGREGMDMGGKGREGKGERGRKGREKGREEEGREGGKVASWLLGGWTPLITQNIFREIKDPKHPLHYLLPPVKVSHSQMVFQPTYTRISFHLAKLLAMDEILCLTAFPRSFRVTTLTFPRPAAAKRHRNNSV